VETELSREAQIARVFVELADTLVEDFDVIDLLTLVTMRCVEVLDLDAAGLLLLGADGHLRVAAASSDQAQLLELIASQAHEGPCYESFKSGAPIGVPNLSEQTARWPQFAAAATAMQFSSAQSLPLRVRGAVIGVLGLFHHEVDGFRPDDIVIAQAFADVATVSILQHRSIVEQQTVAGQLANALETRVIIEQAKGVIAGQTGWPMEKSVDALRRYARSKQRRLVEVAAEIIDGRTSVDDL
jgi:transcriptional regulator with GAF, ATPase, and Fis domain